mgnify:FL=1
MSNFIPVEGNSDLVRDSRTNQIINTNNTEYEQYLARRKKRKLEKEKSLSVEEDLASLKNEMNEIKSLLKELVNGK